MYVLVSFVYFTKYDDTYLQGLHLPHPLLHLLCILLAYFKKSSNKLCPLNLSKVKHSTQLLECYSCMHVILVLMKHNNTYFQKGIAPITPPASILLYYNFWKFIKSSIKLDFDLLKSKQVMASRVLLKIDNIIIV